MFSIVHILHKQLLSVKECYTVLDENEQVDDKNPQVEEGRGLRTAGV